MTTATIAKTQPDTAVRWDRHSGVLGCEVCDGTGLVECGHYRIDCDECGGEGHLPCAVCGYGTQLTGFDCIVCETVAAITDEDLPRVEFSDLVHAFGHALKARAPSAMLAERAP